MDGIKRRNEKSWHTFPTVLAMIIILRCLWSESRATIHKFRFELTKSHQNIGHMKKTKFSMCMIFFRDLLTGVSEWGESPACEGIFGGSGEWGVSRKFAADTCPFCPVPRSFRHAFPLSIISDSDINGRLNRSGLGNPGFSFFVSHMSQF